ncbi:hypothetical protein SUGI_0721870 [Cryptomeria japonica]|nr:hypothetical protein SUGI_0721870 [Cryptomeria japonica]
METAEALQNGDLSTVKAAQNKNNIWSNASLCLRILLIYFNAMDNYTNFPNRVTSNTSNICCTKGSRLQEKLE